MPLNIGDLAPNFSSPIHGSNTTFSLQNYKGDIVLLAFNGITWCPPCQFEAPLLQDLWLEFRTGCFNHNVQFVMIHGKFSEPDLNDDLAQLSAAISQFGITFPVIASNSIWDLYEIHNVPKLYVVGADQKICAIKTGASPPADKLKNEIRSLIWDCGLKRPFLCRDYRWAAVAQILFGITQDQGGTVIAGGKPKPRPPWDPLQREIMTALAINELATDLSDLELRHTVESNVIDSLATSVEKMRDRTNRDFVANPFSRVSVRPDDIF